MSLPIMFEIYDYTNDKCIGTFQDYDEAQCICDEYISNYGEPVEAIIQSIDLDPCY